MLKMSSYAYIVDDDCAVAAAVRDRKCNTCNARVAIAPYPYRKREAL